MSGGGRQMEFGVLGPLQVRTAGGTAVAIGAPKHRVLLALLLLHAGRPVPVDTLADALWPAGAPRSAKGLVRTYGSQLRGALRADAGTDAVSLTHGPGGYLL